MAPEGAARPASPAGGVCPAERSNSGRPDHWPGRSRQRRGSIRLRRDRCCQSSRRRRPTAAAMRRRCGGKGTATMPAHQFTPANAPTCGPDQGSWQDHVGHDRKSAPRASAGWPGRPGQRSAFAKFTPFRSVRAIVTGQRVRFWCCSRVTNFARVIPCYGWGTRRPRTATPPCSRSPRLPRSQPRTHPLLSSGTCLRRIKATSGPWRRSGRPGVPILPVTCVSARSARR